MKDIEKSSGDGDDQEKTIKRSKMPKANILYLYFKSLYLFIFFSFSNFTVRFYIGFIVNFAIIVRFVFTTFEAATQNRNHKTLFKIFESTSERVNFLKRRLSNIQSIFQELVPEEHHVGFSEKEKYC